MRSIHARSSSSLRALASESIGWRWVTLVSDETGSPPMRCVGESGVSSSGCSASIARSSSSSSSYWSSVMTGSSST